ncbi:MAG: alpha-amylase family glycosyl hydrolase, partial [Coriobacteriaceae bacterium]|nr:alpha-amylase family glycosyl hydrolase [Coriobacteriaceae bacterium]
KLNQRNPAVRDYICDVVRFWISEFDVDGIRLDAADVLDFEFMSALRRTTDSLKPDFWLMGEVIHGDYSRWANERTLHSVTDYALHKALYSGHNDHNYFEIAHTVRRTRSMLPAEARLYNFVDNHDVERIVTKLADKAHYLPVHILLYALPGIPSVYYGSEFGIEGRKERGSDDSLRPCIDLREHAGDYQSNPCTRLIAALGRMYANYRELAWGDYHELHLTTGQFAFARGSVVVAVNNEASDVEFRVAAPDGEYIGLLGGQRVRAEGGCLEVRLGPDGGEVFAPVDGRYERYRESLGGEASVLEAVIPTKRGGVEGEAPACGLVRNETSVDERAGNGSAEQAVPAVPIPDVPYEQMSVEQLQAVILAKMEANGHVTDRMRRDVMENIWHDSLVNWANSF